MFFETLFCRVKKMEPSSSFCRVTKTSSPWGSDSISFFLTCFLLYIVLISTPSWFVLGLFLTCFLLDIDSISSWSLYLISTQIGLDFNLDLIPSSTLSSIISIFTQPQIDLNVHSLKISAVYLKKENSCWHVVEQSKFFKSFD